MTQGCERVEIVGRGCDPAFRPDQVLHPVRESIVRSLGIKPLNHDFPLDGNVFGHFGFLTEMKGTAELLEAYRKIGGRDTALVIHGANAGWGQPLEEFMDDGDYPPIWYGNDPLTPSQLSRLINCFDVAVFPNWHEGYGQCGQQAMACMVPTILPKHSGNLEYGEGCVLLTKFHPFWVSNQISDRYLLCMKPDVDELAHEMRWASRYNDLLLAEEAEFEVEEPPRSVEWWWHARSLIEAYRKHGVTLAPEPMLETPDVPVSGTLLLGVLWGQDDPDRLARCLSSLEGQACRVVLLVDSTAHPVLPDLSHFDIDLTVDAVSYDRDNGTALNMIRNRLFVHRKDEEFIGWLDGDCYVPAGWVDQARFCLRDGNSVVKKRRSIMIFPRVRMKDGVAVPDPPWSAVKTDANIKAMLHRYNLEDMLSLVAGPAQATRFENAIPWDENLRGWGGHEQATWPLMLLDGCTPCLGLPVYHQEHPVQDKSETRERNAAYVWDKVSSYANRI